ncbi:DUF7674 family protein [Chitinophaga arvensicola]|nr:hypothetical protein [Chitinophaga arvensicola]
MSTWRRKALECMPFHKRDIEAPDFSVHEMMGLLLDAVVKAHQQTDHARLTQYYAFAAWCLRQRDKKLWNAAGVSFYEHLGNYEETRSALHLWVDKDVYLQISSLLERMMEPSAFKILDNTFLAKT